MTILYNTGIYIYVIIINVISLFNNKARLWIQGRKNIFKKIDTATHKHKNIVWFHCASLGEFEQGKPVIEGYKNKYPKHKILITFFSPSGYENCRNYKIADWIFYLPIDTIKNAEKFIDIVSPIKVIFIKYEFWFNYMSVIKSENIPLYIISAIFRQNQYLFKSDWYSKILQNVTHFFVQDEASKILLNNIGLHNITVNGDTRFDNVKATAESIINLPLIASFCKSRKTIIAGSTWKKDQEILLSYIKYHSEYNCIIAPHELDNISKLKEESGGLLWSKANQHNICEANLLIIDNIGLLSSIYKYAEIAYVGGGFGKGIHNILEATAFGIPVIFGPNYKKSREAIDLINIGAARSIKNSIELGNSIKYFKKFDGNIAKNYISSQSGATNKIVDHI